MDNTTIKNAQLIAENEALAKELSDTQRWLSMLSWAVIACAGGLLLAMVLISTLNVLIPGGLSGAIQQMLDFQTKVAAAMFGN